MTSKARIDKGLYWDKAWSLISGCTPVSAGCANCWAASEAHIRGGQENEKIQERYGGLTTDSGKWTGEVRLMHQDLDKPLGTRKPTTWSIWTDLFHEDVPDDFINEVWHTMAEAYQHTFQVLTKRPDRMLDFVQHWCQFRRRQLPLHNVWLGVTVENQKAADERIPLLLQTPAAVRFLSCEPLLGPIDLKLPLQLANEFDYDTYVDGHYMDIDWVIVGGESGPRARPMHPDWARALRDQCQAAGVKFFFKQFGEWAPREWGDKQFHLPGPDERSRLGYFMGNKFHEGGSMSGVQNMARVGKKAAGRLLDGREWNEMPGVAR